MHILKGFHRSAAVLSLAIAAPVFANPVVVGFDNLGSLPVCDDCYSGLVPTGFATNYFGTTYAGSYVSNNGYLTFNSGQGAYTPGGLGSGYTGQPIIAAYFADVDTRGAGTTTYGTGSYAGHAAFGVTWNGVGYFSTQGDKTNTFQILLTDRSDVAAGDFDIYYNYGQIQWETGSASGGSNGFGGTSAAVGYNAGSGNAAGTYYELAGSRVPGTYLDTGTNPLITTTNDGVPGQLAFQVRNGVVGGVPEPASWALMTAGFGLVGSALRRRTTMVIA